MSSPTPEDLSETPSNSTETKNQPRNESEYGADQIQVLEGLDAAFASTALECLAHSTYLDHVVGYLYSDARTPARDHGTSRASTQRTTLIRKSASSTTKITTA